MAYTLDPKKPFSETVHTVALAQIEDAIKALKHQPKGLHEAVHDARKKFKRVRGLYRLIRPGAKEFAIEENTRIRDIANALSAERDATALIECVGQLRNNKADSTTDMALAKLETALRGRRASTSASDDVLQKKVKAAVGACHQAIDALSALKLDTTSRPAASIIAKGWKKALTNAQVAMMSAQAHGESEDFHELRKCSQTYWMFCSLAGPAWPTALKAKRTDAKALAEALGNEHDLSVLIALLSGDEILDITDQTRATVLKTATRARERLRKRAIKSARRIFVDEAKDEARVIKKLWRSAAKS